MPGATPAYEGSVATQASQTTPRGPRRRAATGAYTQLLHANPCSPFPFSLFLPVSSSYSFNESSSLIPPSRVRSCFHRNYNLLISRRIKLGSIIRYNSFEYDICIKNFSRIGFLVPETANPRIKHKADFLALTRRESNVKPDRIASNRMRGDTIPVDGCIRIAICRQMNRRFRIDWKTGRASSSSSLVPLSQGKTRNRVKIIPR